jgi:hypothetical protein
MEDHDGYGKRIVRLAAGDAFADRGEATWVHYGRQRARITGTIGAEVAVEVDARGARPTRGAILDLAFHELPKKLLVLVPAQAGDHAAAEEQCGFILDRLLGKDAFRVVLLRGTGWHPRPAEDVARVQAALRELQGPAYGANAVDRASSPIH